MKKNYRLLTLATSTAILTGSLTGCGGMSTSSNMTTASESTLTGSKSVSYETEAPATAEMRDTDVNLSMVTEGAAECYDDSDFITCYPYEPEYNTESYDKPAENGFFLTFGNPLSTFAADVDTASYANVRRMIENGYGPGDINPDAVRPEEFINYFSYDLRSPKNDERFAVTTEISACPWNKDHQLMFVGVKSDDPFEGVVPKSNLVFLIDVSGSMSDRNKLDLLKESFKDLVDNLPGEGVVSIVTYASKEKVVLDGADMKDKSAIKKAINSLSAYGATAGERGMEMAYEIADEHFIDGGNNRIIMATDGDLNVGISDPDELEKFIEKKKESGIFLSVLGFGEGNYKDDKMERLADCGNGNYSYIDSRIEGHKVLVDEMSSTLVTVAKDVKFQIEFNPEVVNAYRLIGYEDRQMDAIAFNDDKKDGGELGAGHSVVALYEIVPVKSDSAVELKYQKALKSLNNGEYATIKIRYKEPEASKSELLAFVVGSDSFSEVPGENLAFAELVAEFAMLLSNSGYAGDITYADILEGYKSLENTDEYKDEFYNLVRMVEKRDRS